MDDLELHAPLIGRQGGRRDLNTPVLVVEVEALDRNIARMAAFARAHGLALRPHAKTHKSVDIARRQLAAGAVGLCCAKIGEAEALADGGIGGLHITSPVVSAPAIARLAALNGRVEGLMVVADHPENLRALARAAAEAEQPLSVVIDIDPGIHRTGVASAGAAVALARGIRAEPSLRYAGVQFYCGAEQHIEAYAERASAIRARTDYLSTVIAALTADGAPPPLVTGGGTGTHRLDAELGVLTELQVGSYVFMDGQYLACDLDGSGAPPFDTSLFVDARVVSANASGMVTVDGGFKAFSTDAGPPAVVAGAPEGSRYAFMGDEHGAIVPPRGAASPSLGEVVTLAAPHCDPTVNLYDSYHVVNGDTLKAIWPVSGRGRSR